MLRKQIFVCLVKKLVCSQRRPLSPAMCEVSSVKSVSYRRTNELKKFDADTKPPAWYHPRSFYLNIMNMKSVLPVLSGSV